MEFLKWPNWKKKIICIRNLINGLIKRKVVKWNIKRKVVKWKIILKGSSQDEGYKCKIKRKKRNLSDTWMEKNLTKQFWRIVF